MDTRVITVQSRYTFSYNEHWVNNFTSADFHSIDNILGFLWGWGLILRKGKEKQLLHYCWLSSNPCVSGFSCLNQVGNSILPVWDIFHHASHNIWTQRDKLEVQGTKTKQTDFIICVSKWFCRASVFCTLVVHFCCFGHCVFYHQIWKNVLMFIISCTGDFKRQEV